MLTTPPAFSALTPRIKSHRSRFCSCESFVGAICERGRVVPLDGTCALPSLMTRAQLDSRNVRAKRNSRTHVVPPYFPSHPAEEGTEAQDTCVHTCPGPQLWSSWAGARLLVQCSDTLSMLRPRYTWPDSRSCVSASEINSGM